MRKVVVTGLGFVTSIGNDKATVIDSLCHMKHGIEIFPPFKKDDIPVKLAAPIKGFNTESMDSEDWTYPIQYKLRLDTLRGLSPHGLYAYCAMVQAIQDAGLSEDEISNPKTGLFTASSGSVFMTYNHLNRMFKVGVLRASPQGIISSIVGTLNFNLVAAFKIKGASSGFASACSSSGHALGYAYDEISLGRHDRMFVVGGEDGNFLSIMPFAGMRVLTLSSDPDRASRPFDKNRNGFVGTGGAVVMILEEESIARKRNAEIYAEFTGWGQASDGYHVALSHPEGNGLIQSMERALGSVKLGPKSIDYINAHAPSTLAGDLSEMRALKKVFNKNNSKPAISSTKALTGHALSLASIMEASFSVLAIKENFMPGSAHIETLDPEAKGLNIIKKTLDKTPKHAMSNSSGFGGSNVSLIFSDPEH